MLDVLQRERRVIDDVRRDDLAARRPELVGAADVIARDRDGLSVKRRRECAAGEAPADAGVVFRVDARIGTPPAAPGGAGLGCTSTFRSCASWSQAALYPLLPSSVCSSNPQANARGHVSNETATTPAAKTRERKPLGPRSRCMQTVISIGARIVTANSVYGRRRRPGSASEAGSRSPAVSAIIAGCGRCRGCAPSVVWRPASRWRGRLPPR